MKSSLCALALLPGRACTTRRPPNRGGDGAYSSSLACFGSQGGSSPEAPSGPGSCVCSGGWRSLSAGGRPGRPAPSAGGTPGPASAKATKARSADEHEGAREISRTARGKVYAQRLVGETRLARAPSAAPAGCRTRARGSRRGTFGLEGGTGAEEDRQSQRPCEQPDGGGAAGTDCRRPTAGLGVSEPSRAAGSSPGHP